MPKAFDPSLITPTTPLRLSRALELAFPAGGMTVSGLRLEASRGRLEIERVAGKDFVTLAAIERMRELCRVRRDAPSDIEGRSEPSVTANSSRARDALRMRLDALGSGSPTRTSRDVAPRSQVRPKPAKRP